jgi:8-oxo-dGTP pyrophosphatase MutT (NUDIX family)
VKTCDNTSVGVLIQQDSRFLMFERQTFPPGIAPPTGHVDDHGSPAQAAIDEVHEEVGLTVTALSRLWSGWLPNRCRRLGGDGHAWTMYRADTTGDLHLGEQEAANAAWYPAGELQQLAKDTVHADGLGLEPVWCVLLHRVGVIDLDTDEVRRAVLLAGRRPDEALESGR